MSPNIKITRGSDRITAELNDYSALIVSEKIDQIDEMYAVVLLDWNMRIWDWEAVVTEAENRAEKLELSGDQVIYTLSNEDLLGLFGGKYAGSPGYNDVPSGIPGFIDANGKISDAWSDIQAYCYIPKTRFTTEVIKELENEI
ncbi:MAG: hypothetical protein PHG06_12375 [Parabacteroides sp.]|nr:hypothetical protein [Parabacteroides sp.]